MKLKAGELDSEVRSIVEEGISEINSAVAEIEARYDAEQQGVTERLGEIFGLVRDALDRAAKTVIDEAQWSLPVEIEDGEPLFDSRRSYLDQLAKYKAHRGKDMADVKAERSDKGVPRKRVLKPRG